MKKITINLETMEIEIIQNEKKKKKKKEKEISNIGFIKYN